MKDQPITIYCPAVLTIKTVVDHKEVFSQAILARSNVLIHAQELTSLDTAGLQLLLNFVMTVAKQGLSWEWVDPSRELLELAGLLGMSGPLKLSKTSKGH